MMESSNCSPQQSAPQTAEVGMLGVVDLGDAPGINTRSDELSIDLNLFLGANDCEWHESLSTRRVQVM